MTIKALLNNHEEETQGSVRVPPSSTQRTRVTRRSRNPRKSQQRAEVLAMKRKSTIEFPTSKDTPFCPFYMKTPTDR